MDTFSITFVCTGNRFRSPLAEAFVQRLTRGLPVATDSYGTLSLEQAPALPEAIEIAQWCGVSLSDHGTRFIDNAHLRDVDLLLGFEPAHVRQAVVDAHASRSRSFTLGDFLSLLPDADATASDEGPVERARSLVSLAGERALRSPAAKSNVIRDPFGGPWKIYVQTASEVRDLSVTLVERLFGPTESGALPAIPQKLGHVRKTLRR